VANTATGRRSGSRPRSGRRPSRSAQRCRGLSSRPVPSAAYHLISEPGRKFFLVIMSIAPRSEVDIALGKPQGAEVFPDVAMRSPGGAAASSASHCAAKSSGTASPGSAGTGGPHCLRNRRTSLMLGVANRRRVGDAQVDLDPTIALVPKLPDPAGDSVGGMVNAPSQRIPLHLQPRRRGWRDRQPPPALARVVPAARSADRTGGARSRAPGLVNRRWAEPRLASRLLTPDHHSHSL
jgi:hypothetical protein